MQLSRFSDYSLRVLLFAALKQASFQIDEVAVAYGISRNHLAKIVQNLARLGYLQTKQGRGGGITLVRAPESISIGGLVRQTENQSALVECFDPETNTCAISGCCHLKHLLGAALEAFFVALDDHTLADLMTSPQRQQMREILLASPT